MIYVVTNRKQAGDGFISAVEKAARAGAEYIILREKDLDEEELESLAWQVKKEIEGSGAKLIVNTNMNIARLTGAYGVHMTFNDFMKCDADEIRRELKIGVSVHSLQEAEAVCIKGVDYILAGHIFETDCKAGARPRGLEFIRLIRQACPESRLVAIGGIGQGNAREVITAGADGVAVMSLVMKSGNPYEEILSLIKRID